MPDIKVSTSADLKGFREREASIDRMLSKSKQMNDIWKGMGGFQAGGSIGGSHNGGIGSSQGGPVAGGPPHTPTAMSQAHRQSVRRSGAGQQYNLNSPSGFAQYYENVVIPAMPTIGNMNRTGTMNMGALGRIKYSPPGMSQVQDSQIMNWFNGLLTNTRGMNDSTRKALMNAAYDSQNSSATLPPSIRDFYQQYGTQLGGPTAQPIRSSIGSRLAQHFTSNMHGRTLGGMLMGGVKGAIGGSLIDMAAGGGETGAVLGGLGGSAIGELAGGPVGAIAAMAISKIFSAVGNQINQGIQNFQQTIPSFSALSHALDNAKNSAVGFQQATQMAGAKVGMTNIQSTQVAQTLAQAFGGTPAGITSLTQQTGLYALINGIDPTTMGAINATAATLGITSGRGAQMNNSSFNQMLLNMTSQSGMQGRQQSLYTGLLSVYSGLQGTNPIIGNQNGVAAQYAALNASGIQGLQGQNAANLMNQMNGSLSNPQGITQLLGMAAIYKASGGKISDPYQMLSIMEQGTSAKIGSTTLGAAYQSMIKGMTSDKYLQGYLMPGLNVNQGMAVIGSNAMNAKSISTHRNLKTGMTISDQNTSASAIMQLEGGKLGVLSSDVKNLFAKGIGATQYVNADGTITTIYSPGKGSNQTSKGGGWQNNNPYAPGIGFKPGVGITQWSSDISKASKATGVPVKVIEGIMSNEDSTGNPYAGSLGGAYGLMQLEPAGHGGPAGATNAARMNPATNILVGAQYLKSLYKQFNGNWSLAAASYYAGSGAIAKRVPKSAYGDTLQQLSSYLNFVPDRQAGNTKTAEQYAADFLSAATGLPETSSLTSNRMQVQLGVSSSGATVVTLSPQTIQQLVSGLGNEIAAQLMFHGGGPSR